MSYGSKFSEKELLKDLLMSEKQVTSSYNVGINDATCSKLRSTLKVCLTNVQNCEFGLMDIMQQRGWHKIREANSKDVESAKKKFKKL